MPLLEDFQHYVRTGATNSLRGLLGRLHNQGKHTQIKALLSSGNCSQKYYAFIRAASKGNVAVIEALFAYATQEQRAGMMLEDNLAGVRRAARFGHTEVLVALLFLAQYFIEDASVYERIRDSLAVIVPSHIAYQNLNEAVAMRHQVFMANALEVLNRDVALIVQAYVTGLPGAEMLRWRQHSTQNTFSHSGLFAHRSGNFLGEENQHVKFMTIGSKL